jgi:hypothetical protein
MGALSKRGGKGGVEEKDIWRSLKFRGIKAHWIEINIGWRVKIFFLSLSSSPSCGENHLIFYKADLFSSSSHLH